MAYWVIDRIEGSMAVCENDAGERQVLPLESFRDRPQEGDCFEILEDGSIIFSSEETNRRRNLALKLRNRILSD